MVLQAAADDFGHVVHKKPVAMHRPGDAQDIGAADKKKPRLATGAESRKA
jgi:hypothetical protein